MNKNPDRFQLTMFSATNSVKYETRNTHLRTKTHDKSVNPKSVSTQILQIGKTQYAHNFEKKLPNENLKIISNSIRKTPVDH